MSSPVELPAGTVFAGDFRVVRPLSQGGMGAVYVVEQISTGKQRALKVMHPNLVHDPKQRQRFVQEAKIGARIESDHVVEIVAAGIDASTPWLVMELLSGETLDDRLARGPIPPEEVAEIFRQLGHALAAAHDVGIVHRDLKPENVFLAVPRREGIPFVVKILDFGIAKLVAESGNTTQAIGSPLWMAPEQTNVEAPITPATDVWAFGLLAYACLTGKSYWRGAHVEVPNPMSLVMEICFEPLVAASARAAEQGTLHLLPEGFDAWFAQCVSRDVETRFRTARPARGALERLLVEGPPPVESAPKVVAPMEAPDLDLPKAKAEKPKPIEPAKPVDAPAAKVAPEKPTQPAPSEPRSFATTGSAPISRTSFAAGPRRSSLPRAARGVGEPVERPFPWTKVAIVGVLLLGGLFAAQRFFWTTSPAPVAPSASHAPVEPPKPKPSASPAVASAEPCPEGMVRIASGERVPGDPTKRVDGFCLDVTEVTVKAYAACVKKHACSPAAKTGNWTATTPDEKRLRNQSCNADRGDRGDHPINCVDAEQAEAYCKAQGKRLPTEIEWEWAARGGASAWKYPWGFEAPDVQLCWSSFTKRTGTCAVASYPKGISRAGVHDLAGNVREWTSTSVAGDRVHCGGDWTDKGELFGLGYCGRAPKTAKSGFVGFRCAK